MTFGEPFLDSGVVLLPQVISRTATGWGCNTSNGFETFPIDKGASQGQKMALNGSCSTTSLHSGSSALPLLLPQVMGRTVAERGSNTVSGFEDFGSENGVSQGQKLALNGSCSPTSLHSGSSALLQPQDMSRITAERGGNTLNGFEDFRTENGLSQGHNLALKYVRVCFSLLQTFSPAPLLAAGYGPT